VDKVSFDIHRQECLGIVGESGCGKSITAMSIARLLAMPPAKVTGQVLFEGKDVYQMSLDELHGLRGRDIGFVFQEPMTSLNPTMKIGRQIAEMIQVHNPDISKNELTERCCDLLAKVGIPSPAERLNSYPHEFSGGMRQRVMIAIAIANNPKLLIADEPTTALDVTIQAQILDLIAKLQEESKMSVLMITHNMGIVTQMCDRVIVMYAGRIVEDAPVKSLFEHRLHPYTNGLLDAIPSLSETKERLYNIPGSVPHPTEFRKGCRFYDRCNKQLSLCSGDIPPELNEVKPQHSVACYNS
ncbi:MAG: ABC transporter ATP-binding protein, partial [Spirochaetales bacterium]|nr:ABC transporter ATP-binding protein [Spirochaetales bacterium]